MSGVLALEDSSFPKIGVCNLDGVFLSTKAGDTAPALEVDRLLGSVVPCIAELPIDPIMLPLLLVGVGVEAELMTLESWTGGVM